MTKKKVVNKQKLSGFVPASKYNQVQNDSPIRIDIGCGKNKKEGFLGVDILKFEGVDIVMNAGKDKWPFKDGTVDEVHASHFVEHLKPEERIHFANEVYRVLKNPTYNNAGALSSGFATVITPHWASQRAYGDLSHEWPAVSEFWFYYLDRDWRAVNAPHLCIEYNPKGYSCHLQVNWGYSMHPEIQARNQEYQANAMKFWKEACSDTIATMTKKPIT